MVRVFHVRVVFLKNTLIKMAVIDDDISNVLKDFGKMFEMYHRSRDDQEELQNTINLLRSDLANAHKSDLVQSSSLESSRKLITEQQAIIAKLVNVKDEVKTCRLEIESKNMIIQELQKEKSSMMEMFEAERQKLLNNYEESVRGFKLDKDTEMRKFNAEVESKIYTLEYNISELNKKLIKIQTEKDEQINAITLDYEEQLQKAHAQLLQMRDEIKSLTDKNNQDIYFYRKKINALENRLSLDANKPTPIQFGNYQKKSNEIFTNMNPKKPSEYSIVKPLRISNQNLTSKINQPVNDPILMEINDSSPPNNENNFVEAMDKPAKRKLFNKNTEYFEV